MQTRPLPAFHGWSIRSAHAKRIRSVSVAAIAIALIAVFLLPSPAPAQSQGASARPVVKVLGDGRLISINDSGTAVGEVYVYTNGKAAFLGGPLGQGERTNLVAVNNHGQILVAQQIGPLRYFLYDPVRKDLTPIGLAARVDENGTAQTVQLVYLTGLDDEGRVFGVYATKHGPCGVVGKPALGLPDDKGPPPVTPADFDLIGCPGNGVAIRSMNERGQMTGTAGPRAFLWSGGQLTTFAFPGSTSTESVAMNDAGIVVGTFIAGYPVSKTGVITPYRKPGIASAGSFVYDGHVFRYVGLP
jgi:hypothetical protein